MLSLWPPFSCLGLDDLQSRAVAKMTEKLKSGPAMFFKASVCVVGPNSLRAILTVISFLTKLFVNVCFVSRTVYLTYFMV